jgi:hypothetical protein
MKLNSYEDYEPIEVILTKEKTPIAYNNKIEELLEEGAYETREAAEKDYPKFVMECEVYYEKGYGVFVIESDAVETTDIYSPSNGKRCKCYNES